MYFFRLTVAGKIAAPAKSYFTDKIRNDQIRHRELCERSVYKVSPRANWTIGGKMLIRIFQILVLLVSLDATAAGTPAHKALAPTEPPFHITESANDPATCVAKWDRYHQSQECFAKYRKSNGAMKPSAYKHCKEVKSPVECSR
jgi:hypothetical protein